MNFIVVPLTVGLVAFFIYKFFELLICRKERLMIVERITPDTMIEYVKQLRMGINIGGFVRSESLRMSYPASWSLRIGCLMFFIGLGLVLGFVLNTYIYRNDSYWSDMIIGGSMLGLGGLGLIVAFIVEYCIYKKSDAENK